MRSIRERMPRKKKEKKPPKRNVKLSYETVMVKKDKQIVYQCIERPTGSILCENFFKEDTDAITDHQNKHKQWEPNGGVVQFLTIGNINA